MPVWRATRPSDVPCGYSKTPRHFLVPWNPKTHQSVRDVQTFDRELSGSYVYKMSIPLFLFDEIGKKILDHYRSTVPSPNTFSPNTQDLPCVHPSGFGLYHRDLDIYPTYRLPHCSTAQDKTQKEDESTQVRSCIPVDKHGRQFVPKVIESFIQPHP